MCSISGFISDNPLDRESARRLCSALLYYGSSRGNQSAGAFVGEKLAKAAMSPASFIDTSDFYNLFTEPTTHALLHTRMPTSGGHGDAQAQPFRVGQTVSVHNGMFYNPTELKNKWNIRKKSGVDSELLTSFVQTYGPRMLPKYLNSTCGVTAAAIWHDEKMYIVRDSNPIAVMSFKIIDGPNISVFASTPEMLMNALRYAWLIPHDYRPSEPADGFLYLLTPDGPTKLNTEKISSQSINVDPYWDGSCTYPSRTSQKTREKIITAVSQKYDQKLIDSIMDDVRKERKLTKRERKSFRREIQEALRGQIITPTDPTPGQKTVEDFVGGES